MSARLAGAGRRIERDEQGRAWLAWHVEALARQKHLPKLSEFMTPRRRARRQSVEEMVAMAHRWTAAVNRPG